MKYNIRLSPVRYQWGRPELKNGKLIYEYEILDSKKRIIAKSEDFPYTTKDEARVQALEIVMRRPDYSSHSVTEIWP